MLPGFLQVFTLTRTGFISQEQAAERLNDLLSRKKQARVQQTTLPQNNTPTEAPSPLLSEMIAEYIKDKHTGWTEKSSVTY
jgi:hypothetical protein